MRAGWLLVVLLGVVAVAAQEEETLGTLPAEVTVPLVLQRHLLLSLGLQLRPASPVVDLSEVKARQAEPLSRHN